MSADRWKAVQSSCERAITAALRKDVLSLFAHGGDVIFLGLYYRFICLVFFIRTSFELQLSCMRFIYVILVVTWKLALSRILVKNFLKNE